MKKEWTGERLETFINNSIAIEHLHRYALAMELVQDKNVLDIACGEGYGSNLLSQRAKKVIGVDISKETIQNAKIKYVNSKNLEFIEGDAIKIPCETSSIDVVVSFETIEHHNQHTKMMEEIIRVLKPDGILIVSTPDKQFYSIFRNYNNPFHAKELFEEEFKVLINSYFKFTCFLSQICGYKSIILEEKKHASQKISGYTGHYENISSDNHCGPMYWIAIASNIELQQMQFHILFNADIVFIDALNQIHNQYQQSYTYKIGRLILSPLKLINKITKWSMSQR